MRRHVALVIVIAVIGAGCAQPEAQVIGKWKVDPASLSTGNAQQDAITKQFAQNMSVEFKSDKTFSMTMMVAFEGTYTLTGHTVTMTPTKAAGVDMPKQESATNKPLICTLSDDGKTLTIGESGKSLKLVKAS